MIDLSSVSTAELVAESGRVGFMIEDGSVKPPATSVSQVEREQQVLV